MEEPENEEREPDCTTESGSVKRLSTNKRNNENKASQGCRRGERCTFIHEPSTVSLMVNQETNPETTETDSKENFGPSTATAMLKKTKKVPLCKYIKTKKGCRKAEKCPFRHIKKEELAVVSEDPQQERTLTEKNEGDPQESSRTNEVVIPPVLNVKPFVPFTAVIKIHKCDIDTEEHRKSFDREMKYFRSRFRILKIIKKDDKTVMIFRYDVRNPEWLFDVKHLMMCISLSPHYPVEPPIFTVPEEENERIPSIVLAHIENKTQSELANRYSVFREKDEFENIGKILFKWIDKHILSIFIEGLKKFKLFKEAEDAGISLVVTAKSDSKKTGESAGKEGEVAINVSTSEGDYEDEEEDCSESGSNEPEESAATVNTSGRTSAAVKPSEIECPINIVAVYDIANDSIATISPVSLSLTAKCARCPETFDITLSANGRLQRRYCAKCSIPQALRIVGQLIHAGNDVIGQLGGYGCRPLEVILLTSHFRFVCFACNKEDDIQKISYDQPHKSWCKNCHAACQVVFRAIRLRGDFTKLATVDLSLGKAPKVKKAAVVHEGVVPGTPLPQNGTCKHYKKSYRWFRFPCCGKLFPCDTCHEEANMGHEMKIANRMVCGHCSTEQPYHKDKPCIGCKEAVTRSKSHFWEGGKGCRDQKFMNKNDRHKFVGSKLKTKAAPKTKQRDT